MPCCGKQAIGKVRCGANGIGPTDPMPIVPIGWLNPENSSGSVYEYNDVRVNALALAATSVWRKPLPQVLKEEIMDKIGASNYLALDGYRNSFIVLDGQPVQSVSGGGHWGGGMFINAFDMARFGLLTCTKALGRTNN